jgi:hypothetical protein
MTFSDPGYNRVKEGLHGPLRRVGRTAYVQLRKQQESPDEARGGKTSSLDGGQRREHANTCCTG